MPWSRAARATGRRSVAGAQALEGALEDGVVVDAGLEPVDAVGDDVGLDGVEGAGGRRRAQGVARLHGAHPGARPQQRRELLQRERLAREARALRRRARASQRSAPAGAGSGSSTRSASGYVLNGSRLVSPVEPAAAQAPAAVARLAKEALADAALLGRRAVGMLRSLVHGRTPPRSSGRVFPQEGASNSGAVSRSEGDAGDAGGVRRAVGRYQPSQGPHCDALDEELR